MLKVGITGGIGSGKSSACKVFELLGIPVYNADIEAKKLLDFNAEVKQRVINEFGKEVINKDGFVDRQKLATLVFNDKDKLKKLNNIIHPAVAKHFEGWSNAHQTFPYILKEAAILFESAADKGTDKIISVVAPIELKIKRTMNRDNISEDLVKQRMNNQISDEEKIKRSDFVIYNDEQQLLIPQIIRIHEQLEQL